MKKWFTRAGAVVGVSLVVMMVAVAAPLRASAASIDPAMDRLELAVADLRKIVDFVSAVAVENQSRITGVGSKVDRLASDVDYVRRVSVRTQEMVVESRSAMSSEIASAKAVAVENQSNLESVRREIASSFARVESTLAGMSSSGGSLSPADSAALTGIYNASVALASRMASSTCDEKNSNPWWGALSQDSVPDAGCFTRRQDWREIAERLKESQDRGAEAVRREVHEAGKAADNAAKAAEESSKEVIRSVDRAADKVAEAVRQAGGQAGTTPWNGAKTGTPRLNQWGNTLSCVRIDVPQTSACNAGPTIMIGPWRGIGPIEWKPLSYCGDMSWWAPWRAVLAAFVIIGAVWMAAKWIISAFGISTPTSGGS